MKRHKSIFWQESVAHQWKLYALPTRPSKSEIAIWETWLRKKRHARTLILGATPELRDLCHRLGHEVTCVDISLTMLVAMRSLMRFHRAPEVWLVGNWTTMPLRSALFDFVIGDFVIGNIPMEMKLPFFASVARVLKKGGLLIHRAHVGVPMNIATVHRQFAHLRPPLSRQEDNEWCFGLLGLSWGPKTYEISINSDRRIIRRYLASLPSLERKRALPLFHRFEVLFTGEKKWWALPSAVLRKMEEHFFRVKDIVYGDDHCFTTITPIHVLKK